MYKSNNKRTWQDSIKEEDCPIDENQSGEEDTDDDLDDECLKLNVDTLEDVSIIVEECSETLKSLHNILSTQRQELVPYLQQSLIALHHLQSQVSSHSPKTMNITSSTKLQSPIGTLNTTVVQPSQDNTSTGSS